MFYWSEFFFYLFGSLRINSKPVLGKRGDIVDQDQTVRKEILSFIYEHVRRPILLVFKKKKIGQMGLKDALISIGRFQRIGNIRFKLIAFGVVHDSLTFYYILTGIFLLYIYINRAYTITTEK